MHRDEMARLRSTDTVLVTSAAGGVGAMAVQIGVKPGATVKPPAPVYISSAAA